MWLRIKEQINLAFVLAAVSFIIGIGFSDSKEQEWQYLVVGFFWLVLSRLDLIYERLKK